jgi:hypothetical protein
VGLPERRKDGDASAQEWPGLGEVRLVRQRDGPGPVRADVGRESAAMTEDSELHLRAKVVASQHAVMVVHAAAQVPADTDALPDLESCGIRTHGRDSTDDLTAEDRRVRRIALIIVQGGQIRVAQTAVFDNDFDVLGPEWAEIDGFEDHRLFRGLRNPCFVTRHGFTSETRTGLGRRRLPLFRLVAFAPEQAKHSSCSGANPALLAATKPNCRFQIAFAPAQAERPSGSGANRRLPGQRQRDRTKPI